MKRRLDDHQDIIATRPVTFEPQTGGCTIRGVSVVGSRMVTPPATYVVTNKALIANTGSSSSSSTTQEVKSENMQSSIQYPMPSFQMTAAISQGGSGTVNAGGGGGTSSSSGSAAATLASSLNLHHVQAAPIHPSTPATVLSNSIATNPVVVHPQPVTPSSQLPHQQFQRLKVEDALSYLDQVKFKFANQPQVYNDFLDIMKEFKSQSIDTPGVIGRVSHLFKGHPELIVGFNTFLPPGYKIEVQANNQVNVCTPGSQTATIIHPTPAPSASSAHSVTSSTPHKSGNHHTPAALVPATTVVAQSQPQPATPLTPYQQPQSQPHGSPLSTADLSVPTIPPAPPANQPVEFNHAINYVNKIKNRFQGQPDIYKQFLEILHTYQKEQRNLKEGITAGNKPLTEAEVYQQVAKLFQNQEDLLQEFGQFLPDANGASGLGDVWSSLKVKKMPIKAVTNDHTPVVKKPPISKPCNNLSTGSGGTATSSSSNNQNKHILPIKRPQLSGPSLPNKVSSSSPRIGQNKVISSLKRPSSSVVDRSLPSKKPKLGTLKDVTLAEAGKFSSLIEYAFFDKVHKALRSKEVYDNFLRCLTLFNSEVVSRSELIQLITPFLGKFPDLFKWFKDFMGYKDLGPLVEPIPSRVVNQERVTGDLAMEIDYSTCKRLGASYCALPKTYTQPKCSGRTQLCKEVLNDTWVSFPSWSEDSTFVSSRKTQYEEYIYRCEDERFELDVVLESNLCTIRMLECVQKKLSRMTVEELSKYRLDDTLGGTSQVIHQRTIRRIYGDKAQDIIDGLKRNPSVAVPLVLRRLKAKEEEWREAQKNFNKVWRDQNEKYYLKSLDHQGINFKQNDLKALRSKSFLNEIETTYDERREQIEEGAGEPNYGPHISFVYKDKSILDDAANLIIHHVKRQTGIHKDDKKKIKNLIRQFVPDLFSHPRQDLSDDEKDEEELEPPHGAKVNNTLDGANSDGKRSTEKENGKNDGIESEKVSKVTSSTCLPVKSSLTNGEMIDFSKSSRNSSDPEEAYTLFIANNNWYLFFRLHQVICERLITIYRRAVIIASEEAKDRKDRKESTAIALRMKPKNEIDIEEYYPAFLDMVKNLLDGNMESTAYEDTLREMFGIHAYIVFTLDKVVQSVVRQLQHIVCDDACIQCSEVFIDEQIKGAAGGPIATAGQRAVLENNYQKRMEQILCNENCFKIHVYKPECRMTVELIDNEVDNPEDPIEVDKWATYVDKYVSGAETLSEELRGQLADKPIFLPRNIRTWRQRATKFDGHKSGTVKQDSEETNEMGVKKDDHLQNIEIKDDTQCKFNLNSYKMIYVVKSESYLYRKMALVKSKQCHKKISERLSSKFGNWHRKWTQNHVVEEQQNESTEWMMGRCEGQVENTTRLFRDNDLMRPPYHPYSRYRVEYKNNETKET